MILTVSFIAGPAIYLLTLAPYGLGMVTLLVTIGVIIFFRAPSVVAYILSNTPESKRSTVLGIYFFGAAEGSGVLTPLLGYLIDRFGFHFGFAMVGGALVVVTLVCSIWLWGSRD